MLRNSILPLFMLIMLVFAASGCRNGEDTWLPDPSNDTVLKGTPISENLFIGIPGDMAVAGDTLIFVDVHDGKMVTVLDIGTGKSYRAINKGRGAGEFLKIRQIFYSPAKGETGLFDPTASRISWFRSSTSGALFSLEDLVRTDSLPQRYSGCDFVPVGTGYVSNGNFDEKYQFAYWRSVSSDPEYFGVYPGDNTEAESAGHAFFLKTQTVLASRPDRQFFAAAGTHDDQLVFYRYTDGKMEKVKEYFCTDSKLIPESSQSGETFIFSTTIPDDALYMFSDLYATQDFLYAAYRGQTRQEVEDMSSGKYLKNRILKFDWSGRFIAGYQVDFLTDFVVDEDAGAIYAFVTDGTSDTLMKYSVSGAKGWQTAAAI